MVQTLRDRIIKHEGKWIKGGRHVIYKDSLGFETVGIGRLVSRGFSDDEIILMFENDLRAAKKEADDSLPWLIAVDLNRRDVVYELSFWLGIEKLLKFKNTLAAIRDKRFLDAKKHLLNSLLYKQVPKRTAILADILETGVAQ